MGKSMWACYEDETMRAVIVSHGSSADQVSYFPASYDAIIEQAVSSSYPADFTETVSEGR